MSCEPQRDALKKIDLVDCVQEHLEKRGGMDSYDFEELSKEREEEGGDPSLSTEAAIRIYGRLLLDKLQRCGWFFYEYRSDVGDIVCLRHHAWQIIPMLEKVASGDNPEMNGLAFGVKAALSSRDPADPGGFMDHLVRSQEDFFMALKKLRACISQYIEEAVGKNKVVDLLSFQESYQRGIAEKSYHVFKTTDSVFKFRSFIVEKLDELLLDDVFIEGAAEHKVRRGEMDLKSARAKVLDDLHVMRDSFRNIDSVVFDIDGNHARYVRTIVQKLRYQLYRDESMNANLLKLLKLWKVPDQEQEVFAGLVQVPQFVTGATPVFYTEKKAPISFKRLPVVVDELDPNVREEVLRKAMEEMMRRPTKEKTYQYARRVLGSRERIHVSAIRVRNDEDLLKIIYLHMYREEQDGPYRILEDTDSKKLVRSGPYCFRSCYIVRRGKTGESKKTEKERGR